MTLHNGPVVHLLVDAMSWWSGHQDVDLVAVGMWWTLPVQCQKISPNWRATSDCQWFELTHQVLIHRLYHPSAQGWQRNAQKV